MEFTDPRPVSILEYADHAMEPFLSPEGKTMYFHKLENNRFRIYRVTRP
jgi:hypothetical protein